MRRWVDQWGVDETCALCQADNQIPPLTVRVNTLKGGREEAINRLRDDNIEASPTPFSPVGLIIENPPSLSAWEPLQKGWFQVQDEAAQLVSILLAPQFGERVLDLCAAPGGKTTPLAELMQDQGEICAVDVSTVKLVVLKENCRRLGISMVKARPLDATTSLPFPPGSFDRVLVDAPCSGLGVIRRRGEMRWRKTEAQIKALARIQKTLLESASMLVRPGGRLVYSTCTILPEENEVIVDGFLEHNRHFSIEDPGDLVPGSVVEPSGYVRTWPDIHDTDGSFAACLKREK